MYFLEERIEDLLGPGKGHGVNRMWKCPWHDEKHASLSVNVEEGMFFCFGCGKKGNYETLCKQFGEVPDDEYKWERAKHSIEQGFTESPNLVHVLRKYSPVLGRSKVSDSVRYFTESRGIGRDDCEAFGVHEGNERIAFPYFDVDGERVLGIKYRHPDGSKTAEPGSSFALPFGVQFIVGRSDVFIFEGESDTLRGRTDIRNDVGVCGTSGVGVSESQWTRIGLQLLFTRRVFLVYDADEPGDKCAETAMRVLGDDKCIRLRPTRGKDYTDHALAGGTIREMLN